MNSSPQIGKNALVSAACEAFRERFDQEPELVALAPGRVNLIGEHIDYNDGFVLPMAIERWTAVAGRKASGSKGVVRSVSVNDEVEFDLSDPIGPGRAAWPNYVLGVISGFQELGCQDAFEAVLLSTVPLGVGLSSSASLEVALATFIDALGASGLDPQEKALLCQRAEHEFAGVPCGVMDQFTSSMALQDHLMLLDCQNLKVRQVPFNGTDLAVLITNTKVRHELNDGEYALRRRQCDTALSKMSKASYRDVGQGLLEGHKSHFSELENKRAKHVVAEIARTLEAAEKVEDQDWARFGELMYESHFSLRDDFQVSCRELDILVDFHQVMGREGGVYGCRMTGGGFGGSTVSLVDSRRIEEIKMRLRIHYLAEAGIEPEFYVSRAAAGGHVVEDNEL